MEGGAYGSGGAGAPFNPIEFIKKPQVIIRLLSTLFAIIVFGCIASRGYDPHVGQLCYLNADPNACSYGIGIGVIAFLLCIAFLVLDALFEQLSSVQHRKYAVLADISVSGLWCFLWFIGFCYMTNRWASTPAVTKSHIGATARNDVQAALAFSFFSTISWGALTVLAVLRYRKGVSEDFGASDLNNAPTIDQSSNPYASFGGEPDQSYQQAPFSGNTGPPQTTSSEYQPPTY